MGIGVLVNILVIPPLREQQAANHVAGINRRIGDLLVEISGGARPHIGSVSVCWFQDGKMCFDGILLPGHRDNVVGDKFAKSLAAAMHTTVSVICGIHYNAATKDDIELILRDMDRALAEFQDELCAAPNRQKDKVAAPDAEEAKRIAEL